MNLLCDWIIVYGFIMPNLVNKYKTIFQGKRGWPLNFPKGFFSYWRYRYTYNLPKFRICQKSKFNIWSDQVLVQGPKKYNLANEYKTFFLGKQGKLWDFPTTFSLYWSLLQICFYVFQKPKSSNLLSHGILVQGFIMPNLVGKYKTIFLESEANHETLQKLYPYVDFTYKLVLQSGENLSWLWLLFSQIF